MKKVKGAQGAEHNPVVLRCNRISDSKYSNTSFVSTISCKVNASKALDSKSVVALSTATLKRKLKDADEETKKIILAELNSRGVYLKKSRTNSRRRFDSACTASRLNSSEFERDWNLVGEPEIADDVVILSVDLDDLPRYAERELRHYFYDNRPKNLQDDLEAELKSVLPNHLPFWVDRAWNVVVDADLSYLYDRYEEDPNYDPTTDPIYRQCLDLTVAINRILEQWNAEDDYDDVVQRIIGNQEEEELRDYWRSVL